ncbi:hypothetical protein [Rhizobium sp. BK176]|uniref:hypothetical protein n=1 Tax=Rhizobium sp. BK176 TaxID=2587071 RepID=UPI0021679ECF|nr:hypothetical protein [Rhizobium sp. BK176]MCS4089130.1 hypothetical protein [Rhizobium sp. BK176]
MHITLPYAYAIHGRRGKLGRTVHAAGVVERDVPEISSTVAPLVAEWVVDDGLQNARAFWGGSRHSRISCRVFDGAHYIQMPGPLKADMVAKDRLFCSGLCIQSLLKLMKMTPGQDDTRILEKLYIGEQPKIGNFGKPLDRVVTSDETFREMAAKALVNSMIFIDGVAWTRCNEPKLRATRTHRGEGMISVDIEFDNDMSKHAYGNHVRSKLYDTDLFFNLTDHEEAKAFLCSKGVEQSPTPGGVQQIVVYAPDQFDFDDDRARLRAIGRELVWHLRTQVGEMDAPTAQDWMTLRETMEGRSEMDNQALSDVISRLLPERSENVEVAKLGNDFEIARQIGEFRAGGQRAVVHDSQRRPR